MDQGVVDSETLDCTASVQRDTGTNPLGVQLRPGTRQILRVVVALGGVVARPSNPFGHRRAV